MNNLLRKTVAEVRFISGSALIGNRQHGDNALAADQHRMVFQYDTITIYGHDPARFARHPDGREEHPGN